MKPTIGRCVSVSFVNGRDQRVVRPGIIVAVWSDECVNLQVLTDGRNDVAVDVTDPPALMWKTSLSLKPADYTPAKGEQFWFWPERS